MQTNRLRAFAGCRQTS